MNDQEARMRLFELLDEEAFQPVLNINEEEVPDNMRDQLDHVQRATASERERFKNYETAEKMFQMYRDDLTSEAAEDVNEGLEALGLPRLEDCKLQVERAAKELGIR